MKVFINYLFRKINKIMINKIKALNESICKLFCFKKTNIYYF